MSKLEEMESGTPVNAISGGGIATFDPLIKLGTIKRKMLPLAQQFKLKKPKSPPKRLRDIIGHEVDNERKAAKRK